VGAADPLGVMPVRRPSSWLQKKTANSERIIEIFSLKTIGSTYRRVGTFMVGTFWGSGRL
jgi:hypothetical protein